MGRPALFWWRHLAACALVPAIFASFDLACASSFRVLDVFGEKKGTYPNGALIADAAGNLYGTTGGGGPTYGGTVFKLAPDGTETVLFAFCASDNCPAGNDPVAGLVTDDSGDLYGTTAYGSSNADGVVFQLAPSGTETVLYSFLGGSDGKQPVGTLLRSKEGYLFGTTLFGGGDGCGGYGCGTVFRIAPDNTEKVLHAFTGGNDGAWPYAGMIADRHGNLYGTASYGGTSNAGVVFELTPDGTENVLYSFSGGDDGRTPVAGLYRDSAGNLFGATDNGGKHGRGTVFKVAPDGTETVLHAFAKGSEGGFPDGTLTADAKGNLFGTTSRGGTGRGGTIFEISANGSLKTLHDFYGESDGSNPVGGLTLQGGNIFGATLAGGKHGRGVVFALTR